MANEQLANAFQTTLTSPVPASGSGSTTLPVASTTGLPSFPNFRLTIVDNIDNPTQVEVVEVIGISGNNLTVSRAAEAIVGTQTAYTWASGTTVTLTATAGGIGAYVSQEIASALVGVGTVTSIAAGSGLSGGTITTSGTLSVNEGYSNTWTAQQQFDNGLVTQGQATATVSNVAVASNIATITTSAAHGFAVGQWVLQSGLTHTALNGGPYAIASVPSSTTYTFAITTSNISSTSDSGTAGVCQQVSLNSSGVAESWVNYAGIPTWTVPGGYQITMEEWGTQSGFVGAQFLLSTDFYIGNSNGFGFGIYSNQAYIYASTNISFSSQQLVLAAPEPGAGQSPYAYIHVPATSRITLTNGATANQCWLQNSAARARCAVATTNASSSMTNLPLYTASTTPISLIAGVVYTLILRLLVNQTEAAEGCAVDLNGGTATFTLLEFGFASQPIGATIGTRTSTAAGTAITLTALPDTNDLWVEIAITLVCNAAGTLIPRASPNAYSSGTLTIKAGSFLDAEDRPF